MCQIEHFGKRVPTTRETYPSEGNAVFVKLADGGSVNTGLLSLDVSGGDDVDPDSVAAMGKPKRASESVVYVDARA